MHFKIYRYSYEISNVTLILQKRTEAQAVPKLKLVHDR